MKPDIDRKMVALRATLPGSGSTRRAAPQNHRRAKCRVPALFTPPEDRHDFAPPVPAYVLVTSSFPIASHASWVDEGIPVAWAAEQQIYPVIVSDGSGGASLRGRIHAQ